MFNINPLFAIRVDKKGVNIKIINLFTQFPGVAPTKMLNLTFGAKG